MPASRSAAAMTRAPRSWPSRPGLATRTRIILEPRRRLIDAEPLFEDRRDLADGGIGGHRFADIGLQVVGARRRASQRAERLAGGSAVAARAHLLEARPGGAPRLRR